MLYKERTNLFFMFNNNILTEQKHLSKSEKERIHFTNLRKCSLLKVSSSAIMSIRKQKICDIFFIANQSNKNVSKPTGTSKKESACVNIKKNIIFIR